MIKDLTPEERKAEITKRIALRIAWSRGELSYKLRPHQKLLYATIKELFESWVPDSKDRESIRKVINCARRFGKTFSVCLLITELCLKYPGFIVRYAAPTEKQLRKIIRPNMRIILQDCPKELRPEWNSAESMYLFKNGSEFHLAGTDKDNVEKLRGTGCDLGVLDEAGAMANMEYVANDIIMPQTLDRNGAMIIISTPPRTPGHDFVEFCFKAMEKGDYLVQTVMDNTHMSEKAKKEYCEASGGPNSSTWRREYMCEFIIDEQAAVVPEFDANKQIELVQEWPRPTHFYPVEAMDVGYFDSTFAVFGYYDFLHAKAIVEDELVIQRARTDQIAAGFKEKELSLYKGIPIYLRKTDIDYRLIADMAANHGIAFSATAKDDKESQVNLLREWVRNNKLIIHPRCKHLIAQLRAGIWNKQRSEFERMKSFGHFDGIDALLYFLRNLPIRTNPYPSWPAGVSFETHHLPAGFGERHDSNAAELEHAFAAINNVWRN